MKKTGLIILTIAILGGLGLYVDKKPGSQLLGANKTQPVPLSTTNQTSAGSGTTANSSAAGYKDGTYTGSTAEIPYGPVQIAIVISGGKITNVNFLQMPSDQGHSRLVTSYAEPLLKQNTLSAQNANIEFVSGATDTSYGYEQSLQNALDQAAHA